MHFAKIRGKHKITSLELETYLEPSQTFTSFFAKIVNGLFLRKIKAVK